MTTALLRPECYSYYGQNVNNFDYTIKVECCILLEFYG